MSESRWAGAWQRGHGHVQPVGRRPQGRGALRLQIQACGVGQLDRQLVFRDGHLAALRAVDDRDRCSPVPLARDQPVPQAVVDCGPAAAFGCQLGHDLLDRLCRAQPVQRTRVDVRSVVAGGHTGHCRVVVVGHDHAHREVEGAGEVQVALVMGRNGHDRAGPVVGEHVVGGVDRQPLPVDRIDGVPLQEHPGLRALGGHPVDLGHRAHLRQVVRELLLDAGALRQFRRQFGVHGHDEESGAVQRVRSRRVDGDRLVAALDLELDLGTRGPSDPVALHGQHLVGPLALQLGHVVQQAFGVVGDPEVPLRQLLLGDHGVTALAAAVDHLLIGQHRLVVGAPVDRTRLAVGQPPLEHLQEQPLVPVVVRRVTRVERPVPVERTRVPPHRLPLLRDVLVRPVLGIDTAPDGRVLGGQTEGVPADGVHDVEALLHPVPGDDVA